MEDTKDAKEKFLRSYADLIESLREEIIIVINGKPYTWNSAYFEIKNKRNKNRQSRYCDERQLYINGKHKNQNSNY